MSKGPLALRTISETAETLGVQQHVLRFWETKFPFIRPTKRAGGRRFYRPQDITILEGVKTLLYDRGFTIRGVQMLFKEHGQKAILNANLTQTLVISPSELNQDDSDGVMSEDYSDQSNQGGLKKMSDETRQAFLDVARSLEDAQTALGRRLDRLKN